MKNRYEKLEARRERLGMAIRYYSHDQFAADDQVRLRQVRLDEPSVDSMFVDVPFARLESDPAAGLLG